MQPLVDINKKLQSLFSDHNSNIIATKLVEGLNEVLDLLIKKKRLQKRSRGVPFWCQKLEKERNEVKALNTKAIETRDIEDVRCYKHKKNNHSKNIKKYQNFKIKENMSKAHKRWKTMKDLTPDEDATPSEIIYKGKT